MLSHKFQNPELRSGTFASMSQVRTASLLVFMRGK